MPSGSGNVIRCSPSSTATMREKLDEMAPLLELREVGARYGQVQALHGISLTVDEGEIVALLGANGAGKTTTLRAVSGTVRRDGDVIFAGKRRTRRPGRRWPAPASRTFPRAAASSPS